MCDTDSLTESMGRAVEGKIIAQAWLGYCEVLFLGFGDSIVEVGADGNHPELPYELQSNYSMWTVYDGDDTIGTPDDERSHALGVRVDPPFRERGLRRTVTACCLLAAILLFDVCIA